MKKTDDKLRVAIYIRVSSEEQKKSGLSLEAQKNELETYALSKNWWIYKIYEDAGKSGGNIKGRPAFQEMLKDAHENRFSAILITKLDRAFRSVADAVNTVKDLMKISIHFISLSEQIDTTTAMGKFFFHLMSSLAELERDLTSERVKFVHSSKFEKGLLVGRPPIGYKYSKTKKTFVLEKNADKIKDIFIMASQGKNYREICDKHKIGITTYYNILRNKAYIGIVEYDGNIKKGTHPPIIDENTFIKVNELLEKSK